jgi:hypothetical protein
MSLPQGYLPRKGDTLLICVDVRSDYNTVDGSLVSVAVTGSPHRTLFADFDKIHSIYARKWNEGDRVRSSEGWGEVVAVHEDQVWFKLLGDVGEYGAIGAMYTFDANDLEPYVEPEHPDIVAIGETAGAIEARDEAENR